MSRRFFKRLKVHLRNPSYFTMASVMIIVFARLDRSATVPPLSNVELLRMATTETDRSTKTSESPKPLPSLEWDFFHPVWKGESSWSLMPSSMRLEDPTTDPTWSADSLVNDPDHRIEKEFQVSPTLKTRVLFWINVFARYSSHIRVVHDRNNMGLIYGYIDLRPIFRVYGRTAVAESKALRVETKIIQQLKAKIWDASGHGRITSSPDDDHIALRNLVLNNGALTKKGITDLTVRIRTQTGQRDMFLAALQRARNLIPHIESVFKKSGLPPSLSHIPFIESAFNVNATSKIGAVGIWQFTPETAREFIHKDEEKQWSDPLKQTASAARLLRNYRGALPDWGTTITSYNSGIGRVRRLIQTHGLQGIDSLVELENASNGLGFAGKNFYAEFLAVTIIDAYKEEIFDHYIAPVDSMIVFKGKSPFPSQACDL